MHLTHVRVSPGLSFLRTRCNVHLCGQAVIIQLVATRGARLSLYRLRTYVHRGIIVLELQMIIAAGLFAGGFSK